MDSTVRQTLSNGVAIPAHPLALTAGRKLDERRQRALSRYYIASGVGGLAVGVHTTQFAIRDPKHGLFEPVLTLAAEEMNRADESRPQPLIRVAGVCGNTTQAVGEAGLVRDLGYHVALLNLSAMRGGDTDALVDHCRAVSDVIPLFGFYLNPQIGGLKLPYAFWRRFAEIPNVAAIKIAPFDRYLSIDVVRAVAEAGRDDIALYTGNDDNIIMDLLTTFRFKVADRTVERRIVGGLLGHWAVWTKPAVQMLTVCGDAVASAKAIDQALITQSIEVTDANAAFFDADNLFTGCIPGLHEVLRRQGLLEGLWCLNPDEGLGPGQMEQIDRVYRDYPHMNDDAFVAAHRDQWLNG